MPVLETTGMHSCAVISIGGFKGNSIFENEYYKEGGVKDKWSVGLSVYDFYAEVLFPTEQNQGRTANMPFEKLMRDIDNCEYEGGTLKTKMCLLCLNQEQRFQRNEYWHHEVKRWGFRLLRKTDNTDGGVNYIYARIPLHIPIEKGER
jgi:hypothetical protein